MLNNTSEVIQAGLRALEEREQQIKLESLLKAVSAGINSGESKEAESVFNRLTRQYRCMAEGKKNE